MSLIVMVVSASLAGSLAILLVTGFKLVRPALVRQMWSEGRCQFAPFVLTGDEKADFVNMVARCNVIHSVARIMEESHANNQLVQEGRIEMVGAMYDVITGRIGFFSHETVGPPSLVEGSVVVDES